MKKRGIISIIILIIAVGALISGGVLAYQANANKERILSSFTELSKSLVKNLSINYENNINKQTVTGQAKIYFNPLLGNSDDSSNILINNLNNTLINYEYIMDQNLKKIFLNSSILLNTQEILNVNFYQENDLTYMFLKNIFDKYIMIENKDIFNYLEESKNNVDDISYIYNKIIKSLTNNITNDDINVNNTTIDKKEVKKISLVLDEKRFRELSNEIVKDLNKDKKVIEILGEEITKLENNLTTNNNSNKIDYSIYLLKDNIIRYELGYKNESDDITIIFNDSNEKSISLKSKGKEVLKGIITNKNNIINIDITSNNKNIGNLTIANNKVNLNLQIDDGYNNIILIKLNSNDNNNTVTTEFSIGTVTNNTNVDILKITDVKNIKNNIANFPNIDTSNSINLNKLTEEQINTIENSLMGILYKYLDVNVNI